MFRPEKRERNNPLLDDEPSITRKRNVELHPGYGEYCVLWRDFMDIIPGMSWKNRPDKTQIPWIRILIERANMTKNSLGDLYQEREDKIAALSKNKAPSKDATKEDEKERESLLQRIEEIDGVLLNPMLEKYRDAEKEKILRGKPVELESYKYDTYIKELQETEKSLISAWKEMESIITKLSENAYVKNKGKVEDYKNALYDMIHP